MDISSNTSSNDPSIIQSNSLYISNPIIEQTTDILYNAFWRNILLEPPTIFPINNIIHPTSLDNIATRTFGDENRYRKVISEEGEETLKKTLYVPSIHGDIRVCPISREKFKEGDEIIELPCKHIFTKEMGLNWLKKKTIKHAPYVDINYLQKK